MQRHRLARGVLWGVLLATMPCLKAQDGTTAQTDSNAPLTPRERMLLERIDKLEQRLAVLEQHEGIASKEAIAPQNVAQTQPVLPVTESQPPVVQAASKPAESFKPKVKIYGRVELDATYSSRGTNPLDPRQFNGYSTAAGPENQSSATFNPRFSVIGIEADSHKGDQTLQAKIETDFYSTDSANSITPRLRLAYIQYGKKDTSLTFGMDWLPVAQLLPSLMDFSIMGYSGNVWQRLPQATVRQKIGQHWELLASAFRFERGFTLQPAPYVSDPFTDPVKTPYIGGRIAYQHWGAGGTGMIAVSGAYRQFAYPTTGDTVHSDLFSVELSMPLLAKLSWNSKFAHGQGLGDEFFRFGQAFNGQNAIRTNLGWTELTYSPFKRLSFASGFGLDNPLGKDLAGISNDDLNYRRNQRFYVNGIYEFYENLKFSLELNRMHTDWTNNARYTAYQPMASIFYTF